MLLCPPSPIQDKVFPCCSAVIRLRSSVNHENCDQETLLAVFRCNFLPNNEIEKILLLTRRAERYLVVGAVRFVRTVLSRHVSLSIQALFFCNEIL